MCTQLIQPEKSTRICPTFHQFFVGSTDNLSVLFSRHNPQTCECLRQVALSVVLVEYVIRAFRTSSGTDACVVDNSAFDTSATCTLVVCDRQNCRVCSPSIEKPYCVVL